MTPIQQALNVAAHGDPTAFVAVPSLPNRFNLQDESEATRCIFYACRVLVKRNQPITREGIIDIWRSTFHIVGWHFYISELNAIIPPEDAEI